MNSTKEINKIKEVYQQRDECEVIGFQSTLDIIDSFYHERLIFKVFKRYELKSLNNKRVIDMGCGNGARLRTLMRFGALPENLYGVDLSSHRVELAQSFSPNFNIQCGDVSETEFANNSFDIVMNSTMMSSICNDELSTKIANEMCRIVKNDGVILWYDLRYNNPFNKNVRGYSRVMIKTLFSGYDISFSTLTLIPNLTRKVNLPFFLYQIINLIPFFRTHYLCIIKPAKP
jgi:ubiquinone/menaquinone biosynthesis C-methylase UbiE